MSNVDEKLRKWSKSTTAKEIIYLFNDGSTENTEFLEKTFQAPIAEIRSDEGNYFLYRYKERERKGKLSRAKRFLNFTLL